MMSDSRTTVVDTAQVEKAALFRRLIPSIGFTYADALIWTGIAKDVAATRTYQDMVRYRVECLKQDLGPQVFDVSDDGKVQHLKDALSLIPGTKTSLAKVAQLVGWTDADLYSTSKNTGRKQPSKLYARVLRWMTKQANQPDTHIVQIPTLLDIQISSRTRPPSLSPLSTSNSTSFESTTGSSSSSSLALFPNQTRTINSSSVESLTTRTESRKTSANAQAKRRSEKDMLNIKTSMHIVGTTIVSHVQNGENPLKVFSTPDNVAMAVNDMYGIQGVSGRQLADAVRNGNVGQAPPRRGRPSLIPDEDFKALALLLFSLSAIEQANADPTRLTRPQLVSLLGSIVNTKMKEDGLDEIDEVSLYERIQKENSNQQSVAVTDPRDAIRLKWLTYRQQKKNYVNWEKECIDLDFARLPVDDREQDKEGYIVFHDGQEARIANFDEMALELSAADATAGGRPAVTPTLDSIPEAGTAAGKSCQKCTVTFGVIGNEPMPPLIIFPSKAKTDEDMKLSAKILPSFQQVEGQYGFSRKYPHDCTVALSSKGGMNAKIFENWICEEVMGYWPDACDQPGKRVLFKADYGPGRSGLGFLSRSKVDGFYYFPGLPNGTGAGQEMDQLFAAFKICAYRNRDRLFIARFAIDGTSAAVTLHDVGFIIFGGVVKLSNGTSIEMEPAFELYFSPEHILRARKKCGYWPATRNALKSSQIRHEVVEGDENEIDEEADTLGALYNNLEKLNHDVVSLLVEKGWTFAEKGKRFVHRITSSQIEGQEATRTLPNTRARQDLLEQASTAGHFYQVTCGGGVMNTSDMLIARQRKEMRKEVGTIKVKLKAPLLAYQKQVEKAKDVFLRKKYKKWIKSDFITAIKYKQGPFPPTTERSLEKKNVQPLKRLYESKYKGQRRKASKTKWTSDDEANLKRLEDGEISCVEETAIYGRALEKQNEFLLKRLVTISRRRRRDVFEKLFDGMADDEKEDITRLLLGTSSGLVSDEDRSCDNPDDSEDDDSFATEWESDVDDTGAAGYNDDSDDDDVKDDQDTDDRADDSDDDSDDADDKDDDNKDDHGNNDDTDDNSAEIRDTDDNNPEIGSNDDGNGDGDSEFENGYVSSSSSDGFESPGDASTEENDGVSEDQASLIRIDALMSKKTQSDNDDDFEKALVEAESRKTLRVMDLRVLIKSRGQEPPPDGYGQKRALESAWRVLEDNPVTWKRSETWTNSDGDELEELLQKSLEVDDDE
jgi:hypothetical protein